jgi:Transposase DDE domain group 1
LTRFGGVYFFHEFQQVLQIRRFLTQNLDYPKHNQRYSLSRMIVALVYPLILGLDRLETASLLRSNGIFRYLTGLPSFPDPQTLRRFLLQARGSFLRQMHRVNDRLLQNFIHMPDHRPRLIFDLDSSVVTVFGRQ